MAPRIYADFNGLVGGQGTGGAVGLDTFGSLRDLANAGLRLFDGMPLTIYDWSDDEEDLEADAVARFEPRRGIWWAEFGPEGFRYVPKKARDQSSVFLCVECRTRLDEHVRKAGLRIGDTCPSCGTPIHAPLAPAAGVSALADRGLTSKPQ